MWCPWLPAPVPVTMDTKLYWPWASGHYRHQAPLAPGTPQALPAPARHHSPWAPGTYAQVAPQALLAPGTQAPGTLRSPRSPVAQGRYITDLYL